MIYYREGFKYQLTQNYEMQLSGLDIPDNILQDYFSLLTDGWLIIAAGYAWDGPSGPTLDTKTFMRGSLVHDALYQMMGEGWLPQSNRNRADKILEEICLEDGMSRLRAWLVYRGVQLGGGRVARQPEPKPQQAGKCPVY